MDDNMEDYLLTEGDTRVELTYIGEGYGGDYNPDDPDDKPLIRFYVARLTDGEWQDVDDASYCTATPITISDEQRAKMARIIMDQVHGFSGSIKRLCEGLSWLSMESTH